MKLLPPQSAILVLTLLTLGQASVDSIPSWAPKLLDALRARDSFIEKIEMFVREVNTQNIENLIDTLENFPSQLKGLDNLDVSTLEQSGTLAKEVQDRAANTIVRSLFHSKNVERQYWTRGLGYMLKVFKGYHDMSCIQKLISPAQPFRGYFLPLAQMCVHVKDDLGSEDKYTFSTEKICRNVNQCSGAETPHPYGDTDGTSVQEACTEESNACDIAKALPMMGSLLWYKVSDFIAQSFCRNQLDEPDPSVLNTAYDDIKTMASLTMGFTSVLHWSDFFNKALSTRAYSNLGNAMTLVQERQRSLKYAALACLELDSPDMCIVGDIFKLYESLKKLRSDRQNPGNTRNLRLHSRVDHAKMVELKKDALQHIELLGNIESLDHNLEAVVTGISGYFLGLAKYDQGIAEQDVAFLKGKLDEFETKSSTLSAKVQEDVRAVMIAANTALAAQLVEEIVILTAKIVEHANPLKVIFGGVELDDIYEQAGEVARATQELAHGIALFATFKNVYDDMATLTSRLKENADQISNLQTMVQAIKENSVDDLGFDSTRFIDAYGSYTPKVDRNDLAENDALWSAYKDSTCDLLFGAQGVGAEITQGVVGGMVLCEKLEGTLAEFFALRENIFDFQFDLVDSLALVVRGNVAKKLSQSITVANDRLKASTFMLGFFMTQYRLQFEACLYCDKLQYLHQGKTIKPCTSTDFFDEHRLDDLIAYDYGTHYHEDERFVYIPTKAQFKGDTGFINLPSLAEGNPVTFRLPANRTWLQEYNWLSSEETLAPFVASFKLYLPLSHYTSDRGHSKTRVKLTSIAGSRVDDSSGVVYNLPLEHSHYLTLYEEGYDPARCPRGKEIINPYSLCDNLPLICDTMTRVPGSLIMPTILSTWSLTMSVETGHENLRWDAPRPATNLLIIAKLKLRFLPESVRKRRFVHSIDEPAFGCCPDDNTYRPKWSDKTCIPCPRQPDFPTNSEAKLRGYYCEKGNEPIASEPPSG